MTDEELINALKEGAQKEFAVCPDEIHKSLYWLAATRIETLSTLLSWAREIIADLKEERTHD